MQEEKRAKNVSSLYKKIRQKLNKWKIKNKRH